MHLTRINMFLNVIASKKSLGISIISLSYNVSSVLIKIIRPQNHRAISASPDPGLFHGGDILMKISKKKKYRTKRDLKRNHRNIK